MNDLTSLEEIISKLAPEDYGHVQQRGQALVEEQKNGLKPTIQATRDYEQFAYLRENRDVSQKAVSRLIKSIETEDLSYCFPILVTSGDKSFKDKLVILDGQHRFEALKALGLPIYYIITPKAICAQDIIMANANTKKWTRSDIVVSLAKTGDQDAQRVVEFANKWQVEINTIWHHWCPTKIAYGQNCPIFGDEERQRASTVLEVSLSLFKEKPFYKSFRFLRALDYFLFNTLAGSVSAREMFAKKTKHYSDFLTPSHEWKGYLEKLLKLMNYKSAEKIVCPLLF